MQPLVEPALKPHFERGTKIILFYIVHTAICKQVKFDIIYLRYIFKPFLTFHSLHKECRFFVVPLVVFQVPPEEDKML